MAYRNNLDLNGNQILNFRVQLIAGSPSSPVEGRVWYDSTTKKLNYFNGTVGVALDAAAGLDTEGVQDTIAAMINTQSGITVAYDDPTGKIDFTVTDAPLLQGSNKAFLLSRGNHSGTQSADTVVDGTTNKVFTAAMSTKLSGIEPGATLNQADSYLLNADNHTDGSTSKVFLAAERTKLTGISSGATANQTDAYLLSRANHTGTQLSGTISDFQTAVDARIQLIVGAAPSALDTLKELADALGGDANFASTVTTNIGAVSNRVTALEAGGGPVKSYQTLIGDGTTTSIAVTHNLGKQYLASCQLWNVATGELDDVQWIATSNNVVTLNFSVAPTTNQFRVVVSG